MSFYPPTTYRLVFNTETKVLAEQIKCRVYFIFLPKPPFNYLSVSPIVTNSVTNIWTPQAWIAFFHSVLFLNSKLPNIAFTIKTYRTRFQAPLSCQSVVEEKINKPAGETRYRRRVTLGFSHKCETGEWDLDVMTRVESERGATRFSAKYKSYHIIWELSGEC